MKNKPNPIEKKYYKNRFYYIIRFNIIYDDVEQEWSWNEVKLPYGELNYETMVNYIITYKYPQDKMQAVINNYLLDTDENSKKEFNDMQEWRKYAKSYAKELLK